MLDFKEGTLIVYSLLGKSPRLRISLSIVICSTVFATIIGAIHSTHFAAIIITCSIVSFLSLFLVIRYFTPIFIPERNTRNCAAIATFTTLIHLLFIMLSWFITPRILLFGLPLVFLISYIYIAIFSRAHLLKRLLVCILQPTLIFFIFFQIKPSLLFSLVYSFNIIIVGFGVISVEKTLNAPMLNLINMIWNDGGRVLLSSLMHGNFSIEDGNPNLGEHTNLPVKLLKISDSTLILPAVHPGPFGDIGGSRMPSVFSQYLKGLIFTLHTPTTHDFNPIRKEELDTIITSIKGAVFSERNSCSKLIIKSNKDNTIKVNLHVFGKKKPIAFLCLELYSVFGDVGYELWEVTSQIANNLGYNDIFIADAHNYYTTEEKSARLGTPTGEIIKS